jgi:signal transduction histidine kinase
VRTRRGTPEIVVAALLALLLGSYVVYTNHIARELREQSKRTSYILSRAMIGIADTSARRLQDALWDIIDSTAAQGIPFVVIDPAGQVAGKGNLPFDRDGSLPMDDPRIPKYIEELRRKNPPVRDTGRQICAESVCANSIVGTIYFGYPELERGLAVIPLLQSLTGVVLLFAFIYIVRTRSHATRERLWAGMARESAHQIGTPLSSLTGWIELLEERGGDPMVASALGHMRGDVARLDRVSRRFERIGREPKLEPVDVGESVERLAAYFRARVPTLANSVRIDSTVGEGMPRVKADTVLLEWTLEVLIKNAIDALAGTGGTVAITAQAAPEGGVAIRVADNGPGVPREIQKRVFDPGFSTKSGGWGIGLSLAKRIIEENHGGSLKLLHTDRGATFEIILP